MKSKQINKSIRERTTLVRLNADLVKMVKRLAVDQETTIKSLIEDSLAWLLTPTTKRNFDKGDKNAETV